LLRQIVEQQLLVDAAFASERVEDVGGKYGKVVGIEDDAVDFRWGLAVKIRPARERLRLIR